MFALYIESDDGASKRFFVLERSFDVVNLMRDVFDLENSPQVQLEFPDEPSA